jgi:hypothetical protein
MRSLARWWRTRSNEEITRAQKRASDPQIPCKEKPRLSRGFEGSLCRGVSPTRHLRAGRVGGFMMRAFGAPVTRFFGISTNRPGGHRDSGPSSHHSPTGLPSKCRNARRLESFWTCCTTLSKSTKTTGSALSGSLIRRSPQLGNGYERTTDSRCERWQAPV